MVIISRDSWALSENNIAIYYSKTYKMLLFSQFWSDNKIHFSVKLYKIQRNVIRQNCLLEKVLQIYTDTFFDKMFFDWLTKKRLLKIKNSIFLK